MTETSFHCLTFLTYLQVCPTIQAALTVIPSRSQFFIRESVTLICEDKNRPDGWTVRRNTSRGTRNRCGDGWGKLNGSTCSIRTLYPSDTGLYWCESMSGSSSSSSSIQLSVSGGSVILQSPVLPVMEGDDVTLSCTVRKWDSNYFSVSDEPSFPSTQTPLAAQASSSLLLYVLLPLASLFVLIIFVFLGRRLCNKSRDQKELMSDGSETCNHVTTSGGHEENQRRKESDSAAVDSTVRRQDSSYGEIFIKHMHHKSDTTESDSAVIYSAVRTDR
ncbi:uncharacterized protein LOC114157638 isoform X1 [Xiphophorus couchianus]|uniref:uncharacterized protein LOC114157638 isoform X1 n=1 Tax=Xiphophorus couchianus TaxID=32473 RepID=UPI0010163D56|nr:uncharacterized protein LOC114157638 isoform X1 [Xiphophorus couchianus]